MREAMTRWLRLWATLMAAGTCGVALANSTPTATGATAGSDRPVRLIVAYAAGGQADLLARALAVPLAKVLGQPVIVDNRPGAGGIIGTRECAQARPDGTTLCLGSLSSLLTAPLQVSPAPYAAAQFTAIGEIASFPGVLAVNPTIGVKNLDELTVWVKAQKHVAFGTSGNGTLYHLLGTHWANQQGVHLEHVAYKGGSAAIADAIAGHVPIVFDPLTAIAPHLKTGALVGIAFAGVRADRAGRIGMPALFGAGPGNVEISAFQGILGPAGMPAPVVDRLGAALQQVGRDPEVRARIEALGGELVFGSPAEFERTLREAALAIGQMFDRAGIKPGQ